MRCYLRPAGSTRTCRRASKVTGSASVKRRISFPANRGLYSKANEQSAEKAGIRRVALPHSGQLSKKRKEYEGQRWFKRAFAFRAGVEGRLSLLGRKYALERCPYHGEDGMGRWVGWRIVMHNLSKISEKQAARQGC
jgi:transposase, IS5 family